MTAPRDYYEKDYYKALGVSKDAPTSEIKKLYRKLARDLHPDKNPGDAKAEARFKEVSEAYHVLSDDARRKEYDEAQSMVASGGFRGGTGGAGFGGFTSGPGGATFDFTDLFNGRSGPSGGNLGDLFDGLFGGSAGMGSSAPQRGRDEQAEVRLSFEDAVRGTTVSLQLSGPDGQRKNMTVRIPAGVRDGSKIRLAGKGGAGRNGAPAGDLFVLAHVGSHPLFGRKGDDLTITVPVSFPEAALGATVRVPTLDGAVSLKVPAGTPSGRTLRARGRGVATGKHTGDLLVTVQVAVPQTVPSAAREALEAYAAAQTDDPRPEITAALAAREVRDA